MKTLRGESDGGRAGGADAAREAGARLGLGAKVRAAHAASKGRYGSPRVQAELRRDGRVTFPHSRITPDKLSALGFSVRLTSDAAVEQAVLGIAREVFA
jgi:hypothetical protein